MKFASDISGHGRAYYTSTAESRRGDRLDLGRRRFASWLWATFVVLGLLGTPLPIEANEQRCNELGANCICAEPFNTTDYTNAGASWAWNPGDTPPGSKECHGEQTSGGGVVSRNASDISGSNDATALSLLPASHQVSFFQRASSGHTGLIFIGTTLTGSHPVKRVAIRFYRYYPTNVEFGTINACGNGKIVELQPNWPYATHGSPDLGFNMAGRPFSPSTANCCWAGPNPAGPSTYAGWRNRWWRFEWVIVNRDGANGIKMQLYVKDVTNNGQEFLGLDTTKVDGSQWTSQHVCCLSNSSQGNFLFINAYRNGTCAGYWGHSHLLIAGWDTDAGQRIGAATEIEGGGGSPIAPARPINLQVGQ